MTLTPVGEEVVLDAERLRLPHVSLADLRKQIREKEEGIAAIEHEMGRLAQGYVSRLRGYEDELRTSIAFDRVVLGTEQSGRQPLDGVAGMDSGRQGSRSEIFPFHSGGLL